MAITRVHADRWECDGCEKTEMVDVPAEKVGSLPPPPRMPKGWLEGKTSQDYVEVTWHAHGATCIAKAVKAAFERATEKSENTPTTLPPAGDDK